MMRNKSKKHFADILLSLAFFTAVVIPLILGIIDKDKTSSKFEKRTLAQLPSLTHEIESINKFPSEFNKYYSDQFGLRQWLIKYFNIFTFALGDSPSKDVTIGKDGWLFLGSIKPNYTRNSDPIGDYRNTNQYSEKDLKNISRRIIGKNLWLKNQGIEYIFFIAPNKHSIYDDKLPSYIKKAKDISASQQLIAYLKNNSNVKVVELKEDLINAKNQQQIYYKKDTHWNHHSANLVQFKLMNQIQELFPTKINPTFYQREDYYNTGGDLAGMIGIYNLSKYDPKPIFNDTCEPTVIPINAMLRDTQTHTCHDQILKALIFRDSFYTNLMPYFSRHFKTVRYVFTKAKSTELKKQVKESKPDIVIEQWVERHLPYSPKDAPVFINYLNKTLFENSTQIVFHNQWDNLIISPQFNHLNPNQKKLKLKAVAKDPKLIFKNLNFENGERYMVNLKMSSNVKSKAQLFYTLNTQDKLSFTQKQSLSKTIRKGDNNIYFYLDQKNLAQKLRLDPIIDKGLITLTSLSIKKINSTHY